MDASPAKLLPEMSDDGGDVQLYRLPLAGPNAGRWASVLSPDERIRANGFRFERDRVRFIIARGLLRDVLAKHVGCDPRAIAFEYGAFGKPALAGGGGGGNGPHFNLSHADDLALLAIRRTGPVGVDVERVDRPYDHVAVAARFFPQSDARAVAEAPESERAATFFKRWTRREAVLKAHGVGIAGLDDPGRFDRLDRACIVTSFTPAPGFIAATAVTRRATVL